jgi:hypothetical protein
MHRAHKEVLFFASPFFEAALSGNWSETGRPQSMSSVITISQPPSVPGDKSVAEVPTEMTFAPMDPDIYPEDAELLDADQHEDQHEDVVALSESDSSEADSTRTKAKTKAINKTLAKLQSADKQEGPSPRTDDAEDRSSIKRVSPAQATVNRRWKGNGPDAVIVLKEERVSPLATLVARVSTSHSRPAHSMTSSNSSTHSKRRILVLYAYSHIRSLECTITWNNVEGLMNISHKLCVPSLQRECLTFLLTHAAGKPIKAMRIAELFEEEELYRESSRFVLDNPGGWTEQELSTLSQETLLKLEKRFVSFSPPLRMSQAHFTSRNWFLERVLKLGLIPVAKEYQCVCPLHMPLARHAMTSPQSATCPEPNTCARLVEEKWRSAYHAVFRFGRSPIPPSSAAILLFPRSLSTFHGLSIPADTGRRQPPVVLDSPELPDHCEGLHRYS